MVIVNSYVSLPEGKWFSFTGVEIEKKTSSDYKGDGRKVEHTVDCGFWRGCSAAQFWLTRISHVPNSSCGWWTRLHCKGVESFPTATNDGTSPPCGVWLLSRRRLQPLQVRSPWCFVTDFRLFAFRLKSLTSGTKESHFGVAKADTVMALYQL